MTPARPVDNPPIPPCGRPLRPGGFTGGLPPIIPNHRGTTPAHSINDRGTAPAHHANYKHQDQLKETMPIPRFCLRLLSWKAAALWKTRPARPVEHPAAHR